MISIHLFLCPLFLWGGWGAAALGDLEIRHGQQQCQILLLVPQQGRTQARSEMESLHLVRGQPLGRFPVGVASRTCLAILSWGILDTVQFTRLLNHLHVLKMVVAVLPIAFSRMNILHLPLPSCSSIR